MPKKLRSVQTIKKNKLAEKLDKWTIIGYILVIDINGGRGTIKKSKKKRPRYKRRSSDPQMLVMMDKE